MKIWKAANSDNYHRRFLVLNKNQVLFEINWKKPIGTHTAKESIERLDIKSKEYDPNCNPHRATKWQYCETVPFIIKNLIFSIENEK